MAGLGGFMGYSMGGINWDDTVIGQKLGGHVKAVFTVITIIFVVCVSFTLTSFKEIPLWAINHVNRTEENNAIKQTDGVVNYGTLPSGDQEEKVKDMVREVLL